jgi:hypothetical protein
VSLKDISELSQKVEAVRRYEDPAALEVELKGCFARGEITLEEFTERIKQTAQMVREAKVQYESRQLCIKHIANHYYIPVIVSDEEERINYIKHIIQTPSEIEFINHLERYLEQPDSKFAGFDWWFFSKLDETLDEVYIPYYSPQANAIREFNPDFVFWLQRNDDYFIVFVDPKGTAYTDYEHKIDGYSRLFEENGRKNIIAHNGLKVRVFAFLYTDDASEISQGYKRYWIDHIDEALSRVAWNGHS